MNRLTKNIWGATPKSPQAKALKKAVKASFKNVLSEREKAKKKGEDKKGKGGK